MESLLGLKKVHHRWNKR